MSDGEDDIMDTEKSNRFLASMSTLEGGRKRFLHGTDESQVLDKPLSELTGSKLTVHSLLFDDKSEPEGKKKKRKKQKDLKAKEASKLEGDLEKIYNKTVEKSKKKLSLAAPLSTPQAQKASRSATYKKVGQEVKQWDAVIHSRRVAEVITYPLEKPDMKLKSVAQHNDTNFTPRTPLEAEVMAALHGGPKSADGVQQKIKAGLTFKEQWQQMQETAKLKAHIRYQEAKIARQNKIKSKSYRRHLRKQKAKEKEKELEELKKTNPELVDEQMADAESNRTLERATLKHTSLNKNKKLQFKSTADKKSGEKKTNTATKAIVDSMAQKRRELLSGKKVVEDDEKSSDDDDDDDVLNGDEKEPVFNVDVLLSEEKNPWMGTNNNDAELKEKMVTLLKGLEQKSDKDRLAQTAELNPQDFALVKEKRLLNVANGGSDEEDEGSDDEERRQQIGEIFADDNLIAEEFEADKAAFKNRNKKQKVDLALPGWGCWSGAERKIRRRRPIDKVKLGAKMPESAKAPPKENMCNPREHVIISDDKSGLRDKQTSSVPFPFTSVADYEASLRLPLGDTFIPRTSHQKVIKPKQKIPLGTVIEPMDKGVLVKRGILPAKTLDMIQ